MKVSLNAIRWNGYTAVVKKSPDELAKLIGAQLGEVEDVVSLGERYQGIVVARVVSCGKHPGADKLSVCAIDDGGVVKNVPRHDDGTVQVVCGAPNVRAGLTVAWLPPGTVVPSTYDKEQFKLEARAIRGQISHGMLASPAELALSDDHQGILEITAQDVGHELLTPGTPLVKLYGLDDTVIEIENKMFTHRPDLFGQLGIARELAGIQALPFKSPKWYLSPLVLDLVKDPAIKGLSVDNQLPGLVPRYMAVALGGIKVQPSPVWLQSYLTRLGVRPINNIVDMTNYMMLLTGQPLHAFDFDKVAKDGQADLVIRHPRKGESITTLDGKTIQPRAEAILIANQRQAIAIGGVMGGQNSEIGPETTRVIIECANFDMYNIRRTAMEQGMFSESVTRFTKGQSVWQCPMVLAKAAQMTMELSPGAQVASKTVDHHKHLAANKTVKLSASFINDRLGAELKPPAIAGLLRNVEFQVEHRGDQLEVTAPFWRTDIEIPEDVVEEVGRLIGYDNLPQVLRQRSLQPAARNAAVDLKTRLTDILSAGGANQLLTYSFVHGELLKRSGQDPTQAFRLSNALSPDLQYYRMSLMPSLLDKVHPNLRAGYEAFALFEINKAHHKLHAADDHGLPSEFEMLGLVYAATPKAAAQQRGAAFYQVRAYLDYLAAQLGLSLMYQPITKPLAYPIMKPYDPSRAALITVKGSKIVLGVIGEFTATTRQQLKLPDYTAGFEIGLQELTQALPLARGYQPLSKFPKTSQDISLAVDPATSYQAVYDCLDKVLDVARNAHGYMTDLLPKDIYQSKDGRQKHVTLRVTLTHFARTLTTQEVNQLLNQMAATAKKQLGANRL